MNYPGFSGVRGWCSERKADRLAMHSKNAKLCVEIGVFCGQSFFAMALGNVETQLVAIDPWSEQEAAQEVAPGAEKAFDWEEIYQTFEKNLARYRVADRTKVLRMPAAVAVDFVDSSIDLLHIDGNHDPVKVMADVKAWVPKVRKGGIVVLDDVNWESVAPAVEWLKANTSEYRDFGTWGEARV